MSNNINIPELEVNELYSGGLSIREIARKFSVDKGVIKRRLLKHGVNLRSLSEANRIYSFDENIFETIDSNEKAYWLGFIASDGSVYGNTLKIGLSHKDYSHLQKYQAFLKSSHPIHIYHPKVNGKTYKSCDLSIKSNKLVSDLLKLNITDNKSRTLIPSVLDDKFLNSYILGIIDGDGCFSVDKGGQMKMNVISSLPMCQFIMDTLVSHCDITPTKIVEEKRSPGMYYCYFGGNNKIKSIIDFLYKDAQVYLDRKHKIIEEHYK